MPFYECVFIARQDLTQSQSEGLAQKFSELLKDNGGKVTKVEHWGLRQLAYRIKKNKKGYYHLMNIEATPEVVAEMERNMRLDEDILRFLTVRVDALEEGPSIQMRYRPEKEEGVSAGANYRPQDGYRSRPNESVLDENSMDDVNLEDIASEDFVSE
ncbi:MAG: 30S ribosomal protein S6 [Proteobacteria bacterium]|nr:30S ribosomal protein S6 [Pseudomonadota bacterium]